MVQRMMLGPLLGLLLMFAPGCPRTAPVANPLDPALPATSGVEGSIDGGKSRSGGRFAIVRISGPSHLFEGLPALVPLDHHSGGRLSATSHWVSTHVDGDRIPAIRALGLEVEVTTSAEEFEAHMRSFTNNSAEE